MTNIYTVKSNKALIGQATTLINSMKRFNSQIQQFVGDFMLSYQETHDSNPFNQVMQALKTDKRFSKARGQIIKWIKENTNQQVKWNKEKDFYGIEWQDKDNKTFQVSEDFYTTNFYDETEETETEPKAYTIDDFKKSLDKLIKKASDNGLDVSAFIK